MQPDAPSQRQAASQAAAAKRTASAMTEEERKLKDAERNRQKRAENAAEKADAAAAARETAQAEDAAAAEVAAATAAAEEAATQANMLELCEKWFFEQSIDWDEWDAFKAHARLERNLKYMEPEDCTAEAFVELFSEWRSSDDYTRYRRELEVCDESTPHEALFAHDPGQQAWIKQEL